MYKNWQVIGLGAIIAAAVSIKIPAVGNSLASLVSCSTTAACQGGNNTGSGPGVRGDAKRQAGVFGSSRSGSGVAGYSTSHVGVYGASSGNRRYGAVYGVYGFSQNVGVAGYGTGTGAQGISSTGSGIYGQTDAASGAFSNPPPVAGVYGYDSTGYNAGVIGSSANGVGVVGQISGVNPCNPGPAVEGFSTGASGWLGVTAITGLCQNFPLAGAIGDANIGIVGMGETQYPDPLGDPYRFGIGLQASGDIGAVISGTGTPNPITGILPPALEVQENGKGLVLSAIGPSGTRIMSLDAHGNLVVSGRVTQHATPEDKLGSTDPPLAETSLAGNERSRTIESVGEAQLLKGASSVRMSAEFAANMDTRVRYEVFVTPEGPTLGIYVTEKSMSGFFVRENLGGHSNAAYAYRIIAKSIERGSRPSVGNTRYAGATSTKLVQRTVRKLRLLRPRPDKRIVPPSLDREPN